MSNRNSFISFFIVFIAIFFSLIIIVITALIKTKIELDPSDFDVFLFFLTLCTFSLLGSFSTLFLSKKYLKKDGLPIKPLSGKIYKVIKYIDNFETDENKNNCFRFRAQELLRDEKGTLKEANRLRDEFFLPPILHVWMKAGSRPQENRIYFTYEEISSSNRTVFLKFYEELNH
ncbi:MAG: hypothetical protein WA101_01960 [Minisyncoccia bacterium]